MHSTLMPCNTFLGLDGGSLTTTKWLAQGHRGQLICRHAFAVEHFVTHLQHMNRLKLRLSLDQDFMENTCDSCLILPNFAKFTILSR